MPNNGTIIWDIHYSSTYIILWIHIYSRNPIFLAYTLDEKSVKNIRLLNISWASYVIIVNSLQIFLLKFVQNIRLFKISCVKNIRFYCISMYHPNCQFRLMCQSSRLLFFILWIPHMFQISWFMVSIQKSSECVKSLSIQVGTDLLNSEVSME